MLLGLLEASYHLQQFRRWVTASQAVEKKRRLNMEQVKTLKKNFELGKMQLARALELQPRHIGIWFQNRRVRWKTKSLRKIMLSLRDSFRLSKLIMMPFKPTNRSFMMRDNIRAYRRSAHHMMPSHLTSNGRRSCNGSKGCRCLHIRR
ncbi:unnamed protein product [Linum tenue]|uniref:Homeobox-leucine zipper protein n=1 Tax=Linum tenue TaxID=586396 RepID=A0AAV0QXD2_9ROSI|nr:unnamed protein product [Linum tenue]